MRRERVVPVASREASPGLRVASELNQIAFNSLRRGNHRGAMLAPALMPRKRRSVLDLLAFTEGEHAKSLPQCFVNARAVMARPQSPEAADSGFTTRARSSFRSSASRKARSIDCSALSRGSQKV